MLNKIPDKIEKQMRRLEEIDSRDRVDGTARMDRLRQIPPETGRFIAMIAAAAPTGEIVEIGTSAGYSTLYLALACRETGKKVNTFEILPEKTKMACETFDLAEVNDLVNLVEGDAREYLPDISNIAFAFLDAEKEVYSDCYELLIPNMTHGALLVADNVLSHQEELQPFVDRAECDSRIDAIVIPIGKGLLVCRKVR